MAPSSAFWKRNSIAAAAIVVLMTAAAPAAGRQCEIAPGQVAATAGLELTGNDGTIHPDAYPTPSRARHALTAGVGGRVLAEVGWLQRAQGKLSFAAGLNAARARIPVERQSYSVGTAPITEGPAGAVGLSSIGGSLSGWGRRDSRVCGFVNLTVGVYWFEYNGLRQRSPAITASAGPAFRVGSRNLVLLRISVFLADHRSDTPLAGGSTIGAAVGVELQHRFGR